MKTLVIPFLEQVNQHTSAEALLAAMAPLDANAIAAVSWQAYPYRPSAQFKIAHTIDGLLLLYQVKEKHVKAEYRNTNDPVYKDSCVEFFLSFDGNNYYNLEFNCLGTALIGYGKANKADRRRLAKSTIEQLKSFSSIKAKTIDSGDTEWRLLLNIPFSVFDADTIDSLAGVHCTGNFYKCGDELPLPHFVSWNPIDHPTPNFHLPRFFGELLFL
jgi:hypothetical protein